MLARLARPARPLRAHLERLVPRSPLGWALTVATLACWAIVLTTLVWVLRPTLNNPSALGSHDWDQMESHRYLIQKTILRFKQFPFWNPYACGGHPNWSGFESGTVVVSPWFPFYLTMTLAHAIRVEVWGSTLIAAVGAWLLSGRFVRSPAARALVAIAFAVNGRWTLQITAGHTWHLDYAYTPWALYFFDRAIAADPTRGAPRMRDAVLCGAVLALMVYTGGIYPLPQTILVLALYGGILAFTTQSARPLLAGLAAGIVSFGLAAPKLLPVLSAISKHPRLTESRETIELPAFLDVLTSRDQDMLSAHAGISNWGWHEWGMYVGWGLLALLVLGAIFGRGARESPLKWIGVFLFVVGFGAFSPYAPWPLLRHLPIFRSQHVPSRWWYPALLLLLLATASFIERVLRRTGSARAWLELLLVGAVGWMAHDIGSVSRTTLQHAFAVKPPAVPESLGPFHTEIHMPAQLAYTSEWAPISLPAEITNIGTMDCNTYLPFNSYIRDSTGRTPGLGARGVGDPAYHGEAYVPEGVGKARITEWTPNEVTVAVNGGQPGEHVVLNQNWDGGWSADGSAAANWANQVAGTIHASDTSIVFRYRPGSWWLGWAVFVLTLGALGWSYALVQRARLGGRPAEG
jgi:hypothetical protein